MVDNLKYTLCMKNLNLEIKRRQEIDFSENNTDFANALLLKAVLLSSKRNQSNKGSSLSQSS